MRGFWLPDKSRMMADITTFAPVWLIKRLIRGGAQGTRPTTSLEAPETAQDER